MVVPAVCIRRAARDGLHGGRRLVDADAEGVCESRRTPRRNAGEVRDAVGGERSSIATGVIVGRRDKRPIDVDIAHIPPVRAGRAVDVAVGGRTTRGRRQGKAGQDQCQNKQAAPCRWDPLHDSLPKRRPQGYLLVKLTTQFRTCQFARLRRDYASVTRAGAVRDDQALQRLACRSPSGADRDERGGPRSGLRDRAGRGDARCEGSPHRQSPDPRRCSAIRRGSPAGWAGQGSNLRPWD